MSYPLSSKRAHAAVLLRTPFPLLPSPPRCSCDCDGHGELVFDTHPALLLMFLVVWKSPLQLGFRMRLRIKQPDVLTQYSEELRQSRTSVVSAEKFNHEYLWFLGAESAETRVSTHQLCRRPQTELGPSFPTRTTLSKRTKHASFSTHRGPRPPHTPPADAVAGRKAVLNSA